VGLQGVIGPPALTKSPAFVQKSPINLDYTIC